MSSLRISKIVVGDLQVSCFLIGQNNSADSDKSPCVIIDPGADVDLIIAEIDKRNWDPEIILLTHSHADHIGAVKELLNSYPKLILACSKEISDKAMNPLLNLSAYLGYTIATPPASKFITDGEEFTAAGVVWKAKQIFGHDPGEMLYYCPDLGAAFVGDVIFAGSIGRTDFPGGNSDLLISGAKEFLRSIPQGTKIYPGHGPATTAVKELNSNPYLLN